MAGQLGTGGICIRLPLKGLSLTDDTLFGSMKFKSSVLYSAVYYCTVPTIVGSYLHGFAVGTVGFAWHFARHY